MMLRSAARQLSSSTAAAAAAATATVLGRSTGIRAASTIASSSSSSSSSPLSSSSSSSSVSALSVSRSSSFDSCQRRIRRDNGHGHGHTTILSSSAACASSLSSAAAYAPPAQQVDVFPSIVIRSTLNANDNKNGLQPQGSFAEAQAAFLHPPEETIRSLLGLLLKHNIGIVAHYYMDVELQGILHGVKRLQMDLFQRQQQLQQSQQLEQLQSQPQQQQHQNQDPSQQIIDNDEEKHELEELLEIYRQMDLPPTHAIPAHPLVAIADSLAMGDHAVRMCSAEGESSAAAASSIICLGVDFMSESVAAVLNRSGCHGVPVYRATARRIGCSLAESAESKTYEAWLRRFADSSPTLHVVYINTSLETKANSASILPTITCTSSNVLQTILQASAQFGPNRLRIAYGPDTYMGDNLVSLLDAILSRPDDWTDARIRNELHPLHTRESLRHLKDNLRVYPHGNCIVHHMFGESVVRTVADKYRDAYVTAHLEVPGEMFQIALEKSMTDEGVVGSTSDILRFIERKVEEAVETAKETETEAKTNAEKEDAKGAMRKRLKFILGTEAGMVTSIVRGVQDVLDAHRCRDVEAEIIFPVSSDAVVAVEEEREDDDGNYGVTTNANANESSNLGVVPGVAGGEGCSTAGGCATCPFMKMNDLDAVFDIVDMIRVANGHVGGDDDDDYRNKVELKLRKHLPPNRLEGKSIGGKNAIDLGTEPIVFMRHFMKHQVMSDDLVRRIENMGQ
ncbi:hypothetical protein ACHAXS_008711 [Conticribra weissflogii]